MNAAFAMPLVASVRGGPGGGGAQLTDTGAKVLRLYQDVVEQASQAAAAPLRTLEGMLAKETGDRFGRK
ncbi:MAG: hypothetical protein EOP21_02195 [Hyphomicrobiales bacterium]|nr:MAG: hypothetical protein EOP21_02195 [Hyphomicrobiales bacterium]